MYISASGVLTAMYRQDVVANNLANLETAGFKPDVSVTRQRASAAQEDGLDTIESAALIQRLKAGVMLMPNRMDLTQGELATTSSPYDLALNGRGFFQVRAPDGEGVRLTRDGRFLRGATGRLVNGEGLAVLDAGGGEIVIPDGRKPIEVMGDGTITQGGAVVGRLGVVVPGDPGGLRKEGHSLYRLRDGDEASESSASVRQFHVERSAVDEVRALMDITSASREVEANVSMMQHADRLNDRMINTFGRVS